ncbi:T9SS C-terminal target domain-containing protein [candidate division KSB1 bacterium]|nr:MAG: T9SS C-terminal target domain-containing protein [candidate division KSB1 bacterium]MBC6950862.1 T9SS C-terminal target domain-containing protein [candidate division KSB1 bacterium]MCE7944162.1 T9SS C-terminal target domain-containing protein [Chlorobi bacterium CHB1]MDL1878652.1 T9SS type A sorting domain-containing protein [Cytophagia bacterium CHB2]
MRGIMLALICCARLASAQTPETFFTIHCEPNDSHMFDKLVQLVNLADRHQVPLTIEFTPQWVDSILRVSSRLQKVREWQQRGHEIGAHHHGVFHPYWDRYTNYPTSVIIAQGKNPAELLGDMSAYRVFLEKIGGDSLMLTMGGPGESDPDQSKDWHEAFIYRTGGGRQAPDAFSSPSVITYGPYRVCQINHFFIDTQTAVNTLKSRYNNTANKDVIGVVTHTFNFAADSNYVIDWMRFVQSTQRKTVRQIMRDRPCHPVVTAVEEFKSIPLEFRLEQNYPNPFNPTTMIGYSIPPWHPATGLVQLKIFDLMGREVKTLVQAFQTAGNYTVTWDGRDHNGQSVASGIYIYILRAGQYELRQRMLFFK